MNNNRGYKQKHHIKNGGGNAAKKTAMIDITVDSNKNNTINYLPKESTIMQMNKYKTEIIQL